MMEFFFVMKLYLALVIYLLYVSIIRYDVFTNSVV
jgi:hypothetical protein